MTKINHLKMTYMSLLTENKRKRKKALFFPRTSQRPSVFRTLDFAISSNCSRFSRNNLAASTFAGLASLGSIRNTKQNIYERQKDLEIYLPASNETTESKIFSIL